MQLAGVAALPTTMFFGSDGQLSKFPWENYLDLRYFGMSKARQRNKGMSRLRDTCRVHEPRRASRLACSRATIQHRQASGTRSTLDH